MKIIERIRRGAAERGGTAVVLTFDPHPPRVVRPDKAPPLLMTKAQKLEALDRAGVQGAAVVRFTHGLSQWDARSVREGGAGRLAARGRGVGRRRLPVRPRSRRQLLAAAQRSAQQYGFRAEKIDPVRYKEFVVSSTRIRRLVSEGRVDEAGALLGHHYAIDGVVVEGAKRGRELGFPTANLATENDLVPPTRRLRHGVRRSTARAGRASPTSACGRRSSRAAGDDDRDARAGAAAGSLRRGGVARLRAAAARRAPVPGRGRAAGAD